MDAAKIAMSMFLVLVTVAIIFRIGFLKRLVTGGAA
jgi:hypothetical protein